MFVTLEVLKLLTLTFVSEMQLENISSISITFAVLKLLKLMFF